MLATLSALEFDPLGYIELQVRPDSVHQPRRRRVNRIATLDGGAVFNDFGYSDADRTITLRWAPTSQAVEEAVDRMTQLYSQVRAAIGSSIFLASIETYTPGDAESELVLLVAEKLNT